MPVPLENADFIAITTGVKEFERSSLAGFSVNRKAVLALCLAIINFDK